MEYKSKYTASEIDARLSQVFDSTLQTKEVEVSEDTTIKADEGFLGLKEVSVKVSGGGGSASSVEYLVMSSLDQLHIVLMQFAYVVKGNTTDAGRMISPLYAFEQNGGEFNTVEAIGIDFNGKTGSGGQVMVLMDVLSMFGFAQEDIAAIPRITEEAFYAL
jgi:hypothetical protein